MLTSSDSEALCELIKDFVTPRSLVPAGQQLTVSLELRPIPVVPVVIIQGQLSIAASFSIASLKLQTRVFKALNSGGYRTVSELLAAAQKAGSTMPFRKLQNFGGQSLIELKSCLESSGFELGSEWNK